MKEQVRQGQQAWDWLVWMISVGSQAQGHPGCLVPAMAWWGQVARGPKCESPTEEVVGSVDIGLFALHLKSTVVEELFTTPRIDPSSKGPSLQGKLSPRCESIRIQKTKDMVIWENSLYFPLIFLKTWICSLQWMAHSINLVWNFLCVLELQEGNIMSGQISPSLSTLWRVVAGQHIKKHPTSSQTMYQGLTGSLTRWRTQTNQSVKKCMWCDNTTVPS